MTVTFGLLNCTHFFQIQLATKKVIVEIAAGK